MDRGENLPQALAMAKRAAEISPRSGPILDSLGWAYLRTGDFPAAVDTLAALGPKDLSARLAVLSAKGVSPELSRLQARALSQAPRCRPVR